MAGIGLRLHRLVERGTYFQAATAYLASAVIGSGPWLSAVFWVGLLGSVAVAFLSHADRALMLTTITYVFCASLLVSGGPQLVVTRYLSDCLYVDDEDAMAPACTGVMLAVLPLLVLALPFIVLAPFDIRYRLLTASLFVTVSLIWMVVVFLSATRSYARIVVVFVCTYGLSVFAALGLGQSFGLLGSLSGFMLGQIVCLCLLIAHIYLDFPRSRGLNLGFLAYAWHYWDLLAIGLFSTLGLWIDNIFFWYSGNGILIAHFYHVFPAYDLAKLVGYLSVIPAAAVFLVRLETTFFQQYERFFRLVSNQGILAEIILARKGMEAAVRSTIVTLLKIQLVVDTFLLLLAPDIAHFLGLSASRVDTIRILILAATCQFMFMILLLLLLYLDARRPALKVTLVFAASSACFTLLTLALGAPFYGFGFLAAAMLAGLLALVELRNRLKHLEYATYMLQPMDPAQ